jgi:DNA-binding protein HU-beta
MALSTDVKAYADAAIEQGKRAIEQAQHALTDARTGEGKALIDNAKGDLDAFLSAVEPYVAQANQLRHSLAERTEGLVDDVRKDPRVARAYGTAESLAGAVGHTVTDMFVAPALGMVGRKPGGTAQTTPAHSSGELVPVAEKALLPAETARPVAGQATANDVAIPAAAKKTAAKQTTAAEVTTKTPAKKTARRQATAAKVTTKTPAKKTAAKQTTAAKVTTKTPAKGPGKIAGKKTTPTKASRKSPAAKPVAD